MPRSVEEVCAIVKAKATSEERATLLHAAAGLKGNAWVALDPAFATEDDVIKFLRAESAEAMAAENVYVRKDGEGHIPEIFLPSATLDFVARHFHHDRSRGSVGIRTTAGGRLFMVLPLDTVLSQLRGLCNLEGNGSEAAPFILRVEQTGGAGAGVVTTAAGTSSLAGQFEQLQVTTPIAEVFVARFIITAGIFHAELMSNSALEYGLGGFFYVQSLSCIKVKLVSAQADHLQRFLENEVMCGPTGAELKKAEIEPADVVICASCDPADVKALFTNIGMTFRSVPVKTAYARALKHESPSELGMSSDGEVSGSLRSQSFTSEEEHRISEQV